MRMLERKSSGAKAWFPCNRPDRPNRPSPLKIGSGDYMENLQKS